MAPSEGRKIFWRSVVLLIVSFIYFLNLQPSSGQEPTVVSIDLVQLGNCVDSSGAVVGHGALWSSSLGSCDLNECFHSPNNIHIIMKRCPDYADTNPDNLNCYLSGNSNLAFPYCCPKLECNSSSPLTTVSPATCLDLASSYACSVWYNLTLGCQSGVDGYNDQVYNFTRDFCNNTCGFC